MKVLWIVNSILPDIANKCNLKADNSSGWLSGILDGLNAHCKDLSITVTFPYSGEKICGKTEKLEYVSFFQKNSFKKDKKTFSELTEIIERYDPDIIHIFGTEYPHTLAALEAAEKCGKLEKTIINIQGLISVCAEHYYAGLPFLVRHAYTLRDFLKRDNIFGQKRSFAERGKYEIAALKKAKHVIGRTEWDKACVLRQNNDVYYHKCYETLRKEFYNGAWEKDKCEPYSVFVTQSSYPLKGFHVILKAFAEVVKKYPTARLYTTGNLEKECGIKNIKHRTYYKVYIKKLIKKFNLKNNVTFVGELNADEMKDRLLKSRVFVLPSSVENSSNSLGEAMLLGVPCVASDVGGVKTFITHAENGLIYPFDEPYMLTYFIEKLFDDDNLALKLSMKAQSSAKNIFDKQNNAKTLHSIYGEVLTDGVYDSNAK